MKKPRKFTENQWKLMAKIMEISSTFPSRSIRNFIVKLFDIVDYYHKKY